MSSPSRTRLLAVRQPLPPTLRSLCTVLAFVLPLLAWALVSYVPGLWMPDVRIESPGGVSYFKPGTVVALEVFERENAKLAAAGKPQASGTRCNPIFFPAPHQVFTAFYQAFITPPQRRGEPWLHESLLASIRIIAWGFIASALLGVPLGILCGTFSLFSRLFEPFIDFIRYMPAPAFGALAVTILGIYDGPKVAIIFIGTFFQMVLVVANTTRQLDPGLLEAAQTLGATRGQLVRNVVIPGILPNLYTDMRILLGWAWTYLIIAELIGASSGISYFIYQQAKYRNYANVYAAIIMIGVIGLATDQVLSWFGRLLFPYQYQRDGLQSWLGAQWRTRRISARKSDYATYLARQGYDYEQLKAEGLLDDARADAS